MKVSFREIIHRFNGISLPIIGGGVQWIPPASEVEIVSKLLTFLEDRRVLYNPYEAEVVDHCVESVLQIRERITRDMEQLSKPSDLRATLSSMEHHVESFSTLPTVLIRMKDLLTTYP